MEANNSIRKVKCPVCGNISAQNVKTVRYMPVSDIRMDGYTAGDYKYEAFVLQCPFCNYLFFDPERKEEIDAIKEFVSSKYYQSFFTNHSIYPDKYLYFNALISLAQLFKDAVKEFKFRRLQI